MKMEQRPKILFILHLPPPVHGAAMVGKYIHNSKLINKQFVCRYINLTTANSLEDIGRIGLSKIKSFWMLLLNIRKEVKAFNPNLVYVTPNAKGGAFYKDFIVVQMLKSMGCKIIVHYHNKGVSTRQEKWLDNILYRKFFKNIKVILLGKSLYQDVKKYVKWEDVCICPNGIPVTEEMVRVKRNVSNDVPRLLFLSNLIESKGVLVLLDALKILNDKGYSFVCDFVGGETSEIDAKRFDIEVHNRGLDKLAIYQGMKYGYEKEQYFNKADIFVFPTFYHNETFGLVNLEAMAHKIPIVATNEGSVPDVVVDGENGLIAEREDPQSLADCIERLLNDESLRIKMGEDGYRKLHKSFTSKQFEANFIKSISATCDTIE
jgi:glycosyltransferase involved in cell wall biosynthesis